MLLQGCGGLEEGTSVSVDLRDGTVLGHVLSVASRDGGPVVSVRIDQVVPRVPDLSRLVQHVRGAARSRVAAM
jgi:hypothetical protein